MKIYVVLRNEAGRRCLLNVYATREAAEQFVREESMAEGAGTEQTDFEIVECLIEGAAKESKFFKSTITLEILHDHPIDFGSMSLEDVVNCIQDGDASGNWTVTKVEKLSRSQMEAELVNTDSDPTFFDLGSAED